MQPYVPSAYVPPPAAVPTPRTPMSPLARLMIGCALGCAALALLVLVAVGAGGWWVVSPARQLPTAVIVAPSAAGSLRMGDLGRDAGVAALLDAFVRASQRQQQATQPPWMRSLQQMGNGAGSPTAGLRMMLPTEAALSIGRGSDGGTAFVAAVNPRGLTRVLRAVIARPQRVEATYRGEQILRLDEHAWATVLDGTFLFANDAEALRGGVDRLLDGAAASPVVAADLGAPARDWDLTGAVTGADGGLDHLLWNDEPPPGGAERARLGVDIATGDLIVGRVIVDCASAEAAATAARALEERAAERAQKLRDDGLDLRAAVRTEGAHATLDWELHGIEAAMAAWIARSQPPRAAALR